MTQAHGNERLRALVVSYSFPPVGGAGVQRAVKLVKYLPDHGIDAEVLTVDNPSVPVMDTTFDADVEGVTVHRARTLEPGYGVKHAGWKSETSAAPPSLKQRALRGGVAVARQLLVPDPQVLWIPGAGVTLHRLAERYDAVVVTAPPFSSFLLGPVARLRRCALVLDYRDEWSTLRESYENLQSPLGRWAGGPLERALIRRAQAVVAATPAFRDHLLDQFPFLEPDTVHAISNGYDPDDFPDDLPRPPTDRFHLTYAGTVFRLTSPKDLLAAVRKLHEREPELARRLSLRFIGRVVPSEEGLFEGMESLGVERLGYIEHGKLMSYLSASHFTLCVQSDTPGVERIYPGKIFELMYLGRPVLTLSPNGALTDLVRDLGLGPILGPGDVDGICRFLVEQLRHFETEGEVRAPEIDPEVIAPFHRRALAGRWAEALRRAVARARGQAL
jgi:glycosyltransferase involved in cell wall biosynthesis